MTKLFWTKEIIGANIKNSPSHQPLDSIKRGALTESCISSTCVTKQTCITSSCISSTCISIGGGCRTMDSSNSNDNEQVDESNSFKP